ncbi:MAG: hypothetical protein WCO88_10765 [Actinomycetota bacterium]
MRIRTMALVGACAVSALLVTACGGDSPKRLTASAFSNALGDACANVSDELDKLTKPTDAASSVTFARAAIKSLTAGMAQFATLVPPADLAAPYKNFQLLINDEITALDAIKAAGRNNDEAGVSAGIDKLAKLSNEQNGLATDLGVPECGDQASTTTEPASTEAPSTAPALTLPVTLVPVTEGPTDSAAPGTYPFEVIDLGATTKAPPGFTLESTTPDDSTLQTIADDPGLGTDLRSIGAADLIDTATGLRVATIWFGVADEQVGAMPASWKDLDCGSEGTLLTSATGVVGLVCSAPSGTENDKVFTATDGIFGISVYSVAGVNPADVADAFLSANA